MNHSVKEPNPNYVPPASRKVYYTCARGGGKSYKQCRKILEMMVEGKIPVCMELEPIVYEFKLGTSEENCELQMRMYDALWPKENPYIDKEKNMNTHTYKKEPIKPVMGEHIKRVAISPFEIELTSPADLDKTVATLRKDIYARVVDMTDKAICNAIIDYAKWRGFTDVFLIDEEYVKDALQNKEERDRLLNDLNTQNAQIGAMRHEFAELQKEHDQMVTDLECAEERCNVKDAYIDELRMKLESMVSRNKELEQHNAFLTGVYEFSMVLKKENAKLKEELEHRDKQNDKLSARLKAYEDVVGDDPEVAKLNIARVEENLMVAVKNNSAKDRKIDELCKRVAYLEGVAIGADKLKAEYIKMEGNKNSQILELIAENAKLKEELEHRDKQIEKLLKENKKLRLSDIAYRYEGF